jgi:hypothetical protein
MSTDTQKPEALRLAEELDGSVRESWGAKKEAAAELRRLHAELDRLTACLAKANSQAEHFEREWYLRGVELDRLRQAQGGEAVAYRRAYVPITDAELADPDYMRAYVEEMHASMTDLICSPPLQADACKVPPGYVLVPVNPTPEMLSSAGMMANYDCHAPGASPDYDHVEWYRAMLSAAPTQEKNECPDT